MSTESKIPVGDTGKDLRTVEQTTGAGLVHTEAVFLADPDTPANRAGVTSDGDVQVTLAGETVEVEDKDLTLEVLEDQNGADGVLTFTFTAASQPWVYVDDGNPVRVTTTQTPTSSFGVPVAAGSPFPVPVEASEIKVYAATGQTVSVYGTR